MLPAAASTTLPLTLLYGHATDALRAADVGIVASGTATLEAALARCPHVIFYRVHRADRADRAPQAAAALGRAAQRARRALRRAGVPAGATRRPTNLAQAALNLFDDTVTRRRLEALFAGFAGVADGGHRRRSPPRRSRAELRAGAASPR